MTEWYTREESETSEQFGTIPEKRDIETLLNNGFVIVDKPFGPTSNQVSSWIKKELHRKKAGHFGTLDPNATGVLPIGLNKGTRIQKALSNATKEYVFEVLFEEEIDEDEVKEALTGFEGTNKQTPPELSAVKQQEREREVYEIELLDVKGKKVLGRVKCESGFYVRVLVEQLSDKLDNEAEMPELRRTKQGDITGEATATIQDIVDAYHFYKEGDEQPLREVVHPIEHAVKHLKKVVIKDSAVNAVANGAPLGGNGISKLQDGIEEDETIAVMTLKGELVALATSTTTSEEMYDTDETVAELQSVHMKQDLYPKRWKQ